MARFVIHSGGSASFLVKDGDSLTVQSGGVSSDSSVQSGGHEIVASGGRADGDIVLNGGLQILRQGGFEHDVTIQGGGILRRVDDRVGPSNREVVAGTVGAQFTSAGVTYDAGARVNTFDTLVVSQGAEVVNSGGIAFATTVRNGGEMFVFSGRRAANTTTVGDGILNDSGGSVVGTTIDNGRLAFQGAKHQVLAGTLEGGGGLLFQEAGTLMVSADASTFHGVVEFDQGTLEVTHAGALGSAEIVFSPGDTTVRTLRLEGAAAPADGGRFRSALGNFDTAQSRIDLSDVAFVSGATATLTGLTLRVKDGAYTASFTLSATADDPNPMGDYVVASDGAGGTLIRAKAASGPLMQAAAAFGASSAASAAAEPARFPSAASVALVPPTPLHHAQTAAA